MLHEKLIHPKSIVVVGGSEHFDQLGGSVLKNLIDQQFKGDLFVVNPKRDQVQGLKSYRDIETIPQVDLAIIAIAAPHVPDVVRVLCDKKNTKGFILFSSGFSELNEKGEMLEKEISQMITKAGGSLLGPNNIGMINMHFAGIFTSPVPKLNPKGADFISGSGATAVFTLEAAQQIGLSFSSLFTVGNSAQVGIEDVLEYLDFSYKEGISSKVKMLYIEGIKKPKKLLSHCLSLKEKGCSIVALKSGTTEKGTKAASSHTGALANSDLFVQALFDKAGIIRCYSRYELVNTAGLLLLKKSAVKNMAVITHAGGPGVILTDSLCENGVEVPNLTMDHQREISKILSPGASVQNPIDIMATGTAQQLDNILNYCDNKIEEVDAMAVIFGSPGLESVKKAYQVIDKWCKKSKKSIFPILPSVVNVKEDIREFIDLGNIAFYDEFIVGSCLGKVSSSSVKSESSLEEFEQEKNLIGLIDSLSDGYIPLDKAFELLNFIEVESVSQHLIHTETEIKILSKKFEYPVVQKVSGPLHKTEEKGVLLNVQTPKELIANFKTLMTIPGANGVIVQPMIKGHEIFIGSKREKGFPPLIVCGAGGIYVEVFKDLQFSLCPVSSDEALSMLQKLNLFPVLKGYRGKPGIDIIALSKVIEKISTLVSRFPEIAELDINPLMADSKNLRVVDARIRIEK